MDTRRITALMLSLVLMLAVSAVSAEGEAEAAGQKLAAVFGNPVTANVRKANDYDAVNARYVFIGNKSLGAELCVAIRISDEQMYLWGLALTPENVAAAKGVFDESAPFCSLTYYEGNRTKESAIYSRTLTSVLPFGHFMAEVDRITAPLTRGKPEPEAGTIADDAVLAAYPGLRWGMTAGEVMDLYGREQFDEKKTARGTVLVARPKICGKTGMVFFTFSGDRLGTISITPAAAALDRCAAVLAETYGEPRTLSYGDAVTWRAMEVKNDSGGDCSAWKTDRAVILIHGSSIQYWPVD